MKDKDYFGFKFYGLYHYAHKAAYKAQFVKGNIKDPKYEYFEIELAYYFISINDAKTVIDSIERMIYSSPEFKKLAHRKTFFEKFDKMLND